ncbi:MAG: serine/threonine-protein phosphatase [Ruminococcus sp.]|nr:serine/threonine-protein phosphatase [Ruminococcus sp.]
MVGGDFYNAFFIDDDHLAMVMADVSGKGIPGALFMMVTNILISDRAKMGGTPAEILTFVNNEICQWNRADMFVTVWLGILEVSTGRIIAANAGHDDPAVYRKGRGFAIAKEKHGFVIGGMENMRYRDHEIQLNKGDKLFLYTDGVPEATDANDKMYTIDRMVVALNEHQDCSPRQIIEGIRQSVNEFVGDAPQFDDMTMLCIELKDKTDGEDNPL